jgi:hypothetical protein
MMPPNKPDAANPAIASQFYAGRQWRGVIDPKRWRKEQRDCNSEWALFAYNVAL